MPNLTDPNAQALVELGTTAAANKAAKKENRKARDFTLAMSNTAYQRAVNDMKLAGLNPMLAYNQGGASTPVGEPAPVQKAELGEAMARGAQIENLRANTALQLQQAKKAKEETEIAYWDNVNSTLSETGIEGQPSTRELERGARASTARIRMIEERILDRTTNTTIERQELERDLVREKVNFEKAHALIQNAGLAEAKAMEDWFERVGEGSPAAKAIMSISSWLKYIFGGPK